MKWITNVVLTVLLLSVVSLYFPAKSAACSCAQPESVARELAYHNTVVFSGTVIKKSDSASLDLLKSSADPISYLFEVDQTWKGVKQSQAIVKSERHSASCGFEFVMNEKYLVFAREQNGEFHVGLCSRTAEFTDAQADLKQLGMGEAPVETVDLSDSMESMGVLSIGIWALIGVVAVGSVILIKRRSDNKGR